MKIDEQSDSFVAEMVSQNRITVPEALREARGWKIGDKFKIVITKIK